MRQAGRILAPYRDLKERVGSIETLFRTPELAAQITLMPVEVLGVDAAILFADIFTPISPMGCEVHFDPGPVLASPIRTRQQAEALRVFDVEDDLAHVWETIALTLENLPAAVPLIGFAGSPYTLATYLAEGGGAREFTHLRRMLHSDPGCAHALLDRLTTVAIDYLTAQIRAGVAAVQLFDTWVGGLSASAFEDVVLPYLQRIFAALEPLGVPRIYYANGAPHLLPLLPLTGADVLSLDWRLDLGEVIGRLPTRIPLQGNLDPCALFAPGDEMDRQARAILAATDGYPHVFNLGHGIHPETPCDSVRRLVDTVHAHRRQAL